MERLVLKTLEARCPFDFAQGPEPVEGVTTRAANITSFRTIQLLKRVTEESQTPNALHGRQAPPAPHFPDSGLKNGTWRRNAVKLAVESAGRLGAHHVSISSISKTNEVC